MDCPHCGARHAGGMHAGRTCYQCHGYIPPMFHTISNAEVIKLTASPSDPKPTIARADFDRARDSLPKQE